MARGGTVFSLRSTISYVNPYGCPTRSFAWNEPYFARLTVLKYSVSSSTCYRSVQYVRVLFKLLCAYIAIRQSQKDGMASLYYLVFGQHAVG